MTESIRQDIKELEDEIKNTPYNKATSKHIGRLKAKVANLKEKLEKQSSGSKGGEGYDVQKTGDRTAVLVGFPSVGKSTLLSKLTGAESEIASYDFTTLDVIPGMLKHKGCDIQILDVPGLIEGASSDRGRGRRVLSVVRNCDLVIIVTDVHRMEQIEKIKNELHDAGIRLDQQPPKIEIEKKDRGGIDIVSSVKQELDEDTIKAVLNENKIINATVILREKFDIDRLVDGVSGNKVYMPSLTVVNKLDEIQGNTKEDEEGRIYISAENGTNLEYFKDKILSKLDIKRIYLKPQRGEPDMEDPIVVEKNATVQDVSKKLHREFEEKFRYAKVWGDSAKHDGQQVGKDHQLEDGDILSIITR
ncbi:GTP-binding protein [Methanonatronarchaeum sp. AMET6-2]|uniref:OBG GTPase family GTP-binding protein n=1 Tax=Methanonatronarchaeum sp. AMET6-2 TaxID=2933293 RepID=UPI001206F983|nr:GTP-binding protein [Methanonatronarchaeum sp. AMET6-2]RZN60401.1 MAG: GTP-binding protein [Methanonatronarchaeia archaeon]UOY10383.1 GTP-binding protein [Methanonatronarchaeum sp. AMET6-2]